MGFEAVLEYISVATGILYIYLITKGNYLGWIPGFVSSAILVYLYWQSGVYMVMLLNVYYVVIAVYSYINWRKIGKAGTQIVVTNLSFKTHALIVTVIFVATALIFKFVFINPQTDIYTSLNLIEFLDVLIVCMSITAMFLQSKKILYCWLYWIAANSLNIFLLILTGLYSVIVLLLVFIAFSIIGFIRWRKLVKANP